MRSGATCSAGQAKKDWGRCWECVVDILEFIEDCGDHIYAVSENPIKGFASTSQNT